MIKSNFRGLSGVLFLTVIFLVVVVVTTVCAENRNPTPIDKHQTKLFGAPNSDTYGNSIAIDSAGNCYSTGYTYGNLDGEIKTGYTDTYIVKYNKNAKKQWTKLLGAAESSTYGQGIAIDSAGNCYITGYTEGNLDGQIKTGKGDAFIAKYDRNGNKQWTNLLGVAKRHTDGRDIVIDSAGNAYITGTTEGNLDGEIKTGEADAFIVKYDTNGNKQWTKLLGATGSYAAGNDIAIDSAGNCYITGWTDGNFDGQTKAGYIDAFIVKCDRNGNKQWTKLLGAAESSNYGNGIVIDSAGNCYITGEIDRESTIGDIDAFIVKYDTNGNKQWMKLLGVAKRHIDGKGIAIDSVGNCYITGDIGGNRDRQTKIVKWDAFIVKYDANGNKQWMKLFGAPQNDTHAEGIAIDRIGNWYITGYTNGDLDGQKLTGTEDAFIISKVNP